jgi:NADH dehydrogenase
MEGQETVFIAGDLAHIEKDGSPLPMVAPVAIQQGRHAARNILRHIKGRNCCRSLCRQGIDGNDWS